MMKARKTPLRTCIGCNTARDKRDLVRVVRDAEGHVHVDPTGKAPGRGAYVCANAECFETAVRRKRLDPALKVRLREDDYDRLTRELHEMLATELSRQGE